MSRVIADPVEMIRQGAPHLIHDEEQLTLYTEALFHLTAKDDRSIHDEEAISLLTLLIDHYEAVRYPIPDVDAADVIRFLLERNGLSQRDLAQELGSDTTVSLVLSGKRQLTRDQIARLSLRFHVAPSVFFVYPKAATAKG